MTMNPHERLAALVASLYGAERTHQIIAQLEEIIHNYQATLHLKPSAVEWGALTEADALLITYGDQVMSPNEAPLATLHKFLKHYLGSALIGVHLLPFYPYSSDDGFAVIDYRQVNPALGDWTHIHALGQDYRLMFDGVINHISRQSAWFKAFQRGEQPFRDYFIVADPEEDYSNVVRPRTLPLLTRVDTLQGREYVWTTFSEDQIDLNFANPQVLIAIVDLLLFYASQGASLIRLDAIAYLWKEIGTACINLPQTHAVVRLLRVVLDIAAPQVLLMTETNIPHAQNIAYFGNPIPGTTRTDEAQLVYQFSLAPLLLHTFRIGNCSVLQDWVSTLNAPAPGATFFNFTASHDGIGLQPAQGLLEASDLQALIDQTLVRGGQVSYKTNLQGKQSVYELNITWYDALNDPGQPIPELDQARFFASQVIMLSLAGVPGIYFHSLLGSSSCQTCFDESGHPRSLNRQKLPLAALETRLQDPDSRASRILHAYKRLLTIRSQQPAFHPAAPQQVLDLGGAVFGLIRRPETGSEPLLCLVNVTPQIQSVLIDPQILDLPFTFLLYDLINERTSLPGKLVLEPYETLWLVAR